jgi:hypothetical protein
MVFITETNAQQNGWCNFCNIKHKLDLDWSKEKTYLVVSGDGRFSVSICELCMNKIKKFTG